MVLHHPAQAILDTVLADGDHLRHPILKRVEARATDAVLESVAGLSQLERLDLEDASITDAGLRHLSALTALRDAGLPA